MSRRRGAWRRLAGIGLAVALAAPATAADSREQAAALIYVQSYVSPALVEVCKSADPASATRFDEVLARWRDRNRDMIAEGERVLQALARAEGSRMENPLITQRDALVQQFRAMPAPDRTERCATLMSILESEARC